MSSSVPTKSPHPVFIVGVGMTKFVCPSNCNESYKQLVKRSVSDALLDAGIKYSAVEQAFVGYVNGESGCGQKALYEFGMTGIPIHNVSNNCATGATALFLAKQLVEGGICDCSLAVGFEVMRRGSLKFKFSDRTFPLDKHIELASNAHEIIPAPVIPQLFSAAAKEHMKKYGTTSEHFAKIAWKNHKHSVNNPNSLQQTEYSLEHILAAKEICYPHTKFQCCMVANGSAAAIVASESFVVKHGLQDYAVEILAMELFTDFPSAFTEHSCIKMVGFDMTKQAAEAAYKRAGIRVSDIDVIELHDCFSVNELITYEALGLCEIGKGAQLVDSGNNTYGGKYVINPSGGLISKGHPLGATGVAQCVELVWQLRNQAGKRQVSNAKLALQHNIGLGGAAVVGIYRKGYDASLAGERVFKSDSFFKNIGKSLLERSQIRNESVTISFKVINGPSGNIRFWTMKLKNAAFSTQLGETDFANCTITASDNTFAEALDDFQLLLNDKLVKIDGDFKIVSKLFCNIHQVGKL